MLCQKPRPSTLAYLRRSLRRQGRQMTYDVGAVPRYQHFLIGLKEKLHSIPMISQQTSPRTGCFEHARGRREANIRHAVPRYVQYCERRAVEQVMLCRSDMAEQPDILGYRLVLPARPR